jgi:hypothetical protein
MRRTDGINNHEMPGLGDVLWEFCAADLGATHFGV